MRYTRTYMHTYTYTRTHTHTHACRLHFSAAIGVLLLLVEEKESYNTAKETYIALKKTYIAAKESQIAAKQRSNTATGMFLFWGGDMQLVVLVHEEMYTHKCIRISVYV